MFEDIAVKRNAVAEIDSNADEDVILQSKNTIHDNYKKTGKDPVTEYEKKVVIEEDLKAQGYSQI